MFYPNMKSDEADYILLISSIKSLNREKKLLIESNEYRLGCSIRNRILQIKNFKIKELFLSFQNNIRNRKNQRNTTVVHKQNAKLESNYFSDKRIAVYTCITGDYDTVIDPIVFPNNCDYFLITDKVSQNQSTWRNMQIDAINETVSSLPNAMKNRYIKMFPDLIFPDYEYSVYIDGSIRICTDMTEYVNRITHYGMAFFAHDQRDCVYDEISACHSLGKAKTQELDKHREYLKLQKMPHNYGLPACGIIARKHHDPICKKIMSEWWFEYVNHVKRDQLNLPLVLYRNHINANDIETLGTDMYQDDSFEFRKHNKR